ncbi:MAG: M23 family metallopeptidase [Candidatus Thorarchaeota archaeon]
MRRSLFAVVLIVLVVAGGFLYLSGFLGVLGFDSEGRYDETALHDMGVIYSNRSDILAFNEGYSESDACPWGFVHNGIDYFFANDSPVVAAAPGRVESLEIDDWGPDASQRYVVQLTIRFNATVVLKYGFEPVTNETEDGDMQLAMIGVEVGQWVSKGEEIAHFLAVGDGAHIHFGVYQEGTWRDPTLYMSASAYAELLEMIHDFHPTWSVSYP